MAEAASIDVLDFPENVRFRKGMYINSPNHALYEIVDNAVDAVGDNQDKPGEITVGIIGEEAVVEDNGAGMPIAPHKDKRFKGMSEAEVAYVTLHAGGKFGTSTGYKTGSTGGLNGVGASSVNALSSKVNLIIRTGGKEYEIDFSRGRTTKHLYETGNTVKEGKTGTEVHFVLDKEIWGDEWYAFGEIRSRLHEITYLNPGLRINFFVQSHDAEGKPVEMDESFYQPGGLNDYIKDTTKNKELLGAPLVTTVEEDYVVKVHPSKSVMGKVVTDYSSTVDEKRKMVAELAFAYKSDYSSSIKSYVNNVCTEYGGDHETGFKMGIFSALKAYLIEHKLLKNEKSLESDDCREGMTGIISLKIKDPNFEGQGKNKLRMRQVRDLVKKGIEKAMTDYLNEDDNRAMAIADKVLRAVNAREAARRARNAAREINKINKRVIVEDLADCTCKDPEKAEIFLVEGDSAGGSAKQGRDREHQAILPVFGKVMNAEKADLDKFIKSPKIKDLISALGCGIGDKFDIDKLRYHHIILMSDADIDGAHIQCLHMVYMFRYMLPIVKAGYLYAACPPLFKVAKKKGRKEEVHYLYTAEELRDFDTAGCTVQRYKGLGEMDSEQLWETTMNPESRHLIQITVEDIEAAEEAVQICMGKDVAPRREFILQCAE